MQHLPTLVELTQPFVDAGDLSVLLVYIREAHPLDGWAMKASDGMCYRQPKTIEDRLKVAAAFVANTPIAASLRLLCDDPVTNALDEAYEAPPERLVVVDEEMKVVFASGQGPFQYDPTALQAFLRERLA